jgi:phosphonate transport system permease protein
VAVRVRVPARPRPGGRSVLSALLAGAFAASVLAVSGERLFGGGGGAAVRSMASSLLSPDLSPSFLATVAEAAAVTAAYAVAGMSVALAVGIPGALLLSGVLVRGRVPRAVTVAGGRSLFATLRAIHELVWALILLTVLGPGPLSGILAIGIPYGATIARVLGDRLTDVPQAPLSALAAAGGSPWQVLVYGRLPLSGASLAGYLFYRLECAVRAAAVLSFIGLGGIGLRIEVALADLNFGQVWTLLAALLVLVVVVDQVSAAVRGRYVA